MPNGSGGRRSRWGDGFASDWRRYLQRARSEHACRSHHSPRRFDVMPTPSAFRVSKESGGR
jgi:hypothetical protein